MSKQLPAHSPPNTARNTTPAAEMGEDFHRRGKLLGSLMFTKELTGLSRRKKPCSNPHTTCFEYTQLNLSQNYRWVFRETLKACPSTLASLLIGFGKEHQDTVKSESLLENQIHRLEKFSRATPSWLVGKPQRDCQSLQGGQSWGQDVTHLPQSRRLLVFLTPSVVYSLQANEWDCLFKKGEINFLLYY